MSGEIIEAAHHYANHKGHFELGGHLIRSKKNTNTNQNIYYTFIISVE